MNDNLTFRRISGLWAILAYLVSAISAMGQLAEAATNRPNIVFILADDLGWADVGFHGGNAPTPHLDELSEEGLELAQHYVAPVCSPTRAGFLTGRYWSRFGITTPTNTRALPWDTVTLAKALASVGYQTCLIGKWHLGSKPEWGPNKFGFDHAYGSLAGGVTAWSHRYKLGEYSATWHRNGQLIEQEGHVTDLLADEAVSWIASCPDDKPFFLYVPFTAVHLPINEPTEWLDRVPSGITSEIGRQYAACVMHLDQAVGRIVKALNDKGALSNTLLVFTSDNGGSTATNNTQPYPPDDSPSGALTANNEPLRDQKGSVYEGGTRVPTLVSWPGKIGPGKRDAPVFIGDWMPTFCALAGYTPERSLNWDGIDISGLLTRGTPVGDRPIYIAGPNWRAKSLRFGEWKLVVTGASPNQKKELFHLSEDPSEKMDLSQSKPGLVDTLLQKLDLAERADRDSVARD